MPVGESRARLQPARVIHSSRWLKMSADRARPEMAASRSKRRFWG